MYRTIRADEIIRTAARLVGRVRRCRLIRRPHLLLRLGVVILIVLGAGLAALVVRNVRLDEAVWDASNFIQASESLLGDVVFLGAAAAIRRGTRRRCRSGHRPTAQPHAKRCRPRWWCLVPL